MQLHFILLRLVVKLHRYQFGTIALRYLITENCNVQLVSLGNRHRPQALTRDGCKMDVAAVLYMGVRSACIVVSKLHQQEIKGAYVWAHQLGCKVADVKVIIETPQGSDVYPAAQQMLIHQGKVLKDATTVLENNVAGNGFLVIMLSKKPASAEPSTTTSSPASMICSASRSYCNQWSSDILIAIQQIFDMGGGTWDRDAIIRALHAAFNNPESCGLSILRWSQRNELLPGLKLEKSYFWASRFTVELIKQLPNDLLWKCSHPLLKLCWRPLCPLFYGMCIFVDGDPLCWRLLIHHPIISLEAMEVQSSSFETLLKDSLPALLWNLHIC